MPVVLLLNQFAQFSSLSTVISFQETFSKNCTVYIQFQQAATVSRVRLPDWGNSVSVLYLPIQEEMLIHLRLKATKQQEQQPNKIVSQTATPIDAMLPVHSVGCTQRWSPCVPTSLGLGSVQVKNCCLVL